METPVPFDQGFGDHSVLSKTVRISTDDILNSPTVPIELVPAPGANRYLVPIMTVLEYVYDTAPFTIGSGLQLFLFLGAANINALILPNLAGFIDQTSNRVQLNYLSGGTPTDITDQANQPITMQFLSDTIADGGKSSIIATTYYVVLNSNLE